jgi:predicted enzyme related to lactoylglutathione lyase
VVQIKGVFLELESEAPEDLASFYETVFGLARGAASGDGARLTGPGLELRIRRATTGERDLGPPVGFVLESDAALDAVRERAVAAGAVVLSESKRGADRALVCQDPSGNEITLVLARSETALATVDATERREPSPAAPPISPPRPAAPAPGKITRRDVDRLRDDARLATMMEAIAGLGGSFTADDPATILDEMRAKVGAPERDLEAELARAAYERERAADDLLARYRSEAGSGEAARRADAPPAPRPLADAPAETDDEPIANEMRRSLGRSSHHDDEIDEK